MRGGGGKSVAKATAHALRNYLRAHLLVASHQLQQQVYLVRDILLPLYMCALVYV